MNFILFFKKVTYIEDKSNCDVCQKCMAIVKLIIKLKIKVIGAFMQVQGQVQLLLNMLHHRANPQHAIDLPRVCISPPETEQTRLAPHVKVFTDMSTSVVHVEQGIEPTVLNRSKEMGHTCYYVKGYHPSMFGYGQIIRVRNKTSRTAKCVLAAGSDPRADGFAAPVIISKL